MTFDEVNSYLPDQETSPEIMNTLLQALEERGIEIVEGKRAVIKFEPKPVVVKEADAFGVTPDLPKPSSDPIRMYLSQMSQIPLLDSRTGNLAWPRRSKSARKKFRRTVLSNDFAMRQTVETLRRVYKGELTFDRTIKVSLTEQFTKEQMPRPHAAQPRDGRQCLIEQNKSTSADVVRKRFRAVSAKFVARVHSPPSQRPATRRGDDPSQPTRHPTLEAARKDLQTHGTSPRRLSELDADDRELRDEASDLTARAARADAC